MPIEVVELRRYPVKSMQGEVLDVARVEQQGIAGDRAWGVVDEHTGYVLTARREPRLLLATPRTRDDDPAARPAIELPDGTVVDDDDGLSAWLGRAVRLVSARRHGPGHYETPLDSEDEDAAEWLGWDGPTGTFHDSKHTQLSIASTAAMAGWDVRRFRPNVVVRFARDGSNVPDHIEPLERCPEFALVGSRIELGPALLDVVKRIDRCVLTTRPQPGGIERDLDVLRTIVRERGGDLGVGALVVAPGEIRVGDRAIQTDTVERDDARKR